MNEKITTGCILILASLVASVSRAELPAEVFVVQDAAGITVERETATLRFSRRSCNIVQAVVLGTPLGDIPFPDLRYVDAHGREYSQSASRDGQLLVREDEKYVSLRGVFRPLCPEGLPGVPVSVTYRMGKANGLILVTYSLPAQSGAIVRVRQLSILHRINQIDRNGITLLRYEDERPSRHSHTVVCPPEEDKLHASGLIGFGLFTNGRIGLEVEQVTLQGSAIAPGRPGGLIFETSKREQVIRLTYVDVPEGSELALSRPLEITYTLTPLPYRKYRPLSFLRVDSLPDHDPSGAPFLDIFRRYRRAGGDLLVLGDIAYYRDTPWFRQRIETYRRRIAAAHQAGQKVWMYVQWDAQGLNSFLAEDRSGRYTIGDFNRDRALHIEGPGVSHPLWEKTHDLTVEELPWYIYMCPNAPKWAEFRFAQLRWMVDNFDLDGIFFDGACKRMCDNTEHGCSRQFTFFTLGMLDFMENAREYVDHKARERGKPILLCMHSGDIGGASAVSLVDVTYGGEYLAEYDAPERFWTIDANDADYRNSLLYGIPHMTFACTGLGLPLAWSWPYERALARCHNIVSSYPDYLDSPNFLPEHLVLWQRYMGPLGIFGVEGSRLYHPSQPDYTQYVRLSDSRAKLVVYAHEGEALVVLANETSRRPRARAAIRVADVAPGAERFLLMDTFSKSLTHLRAEDGWIRWRVALPPAGDAQILLLRPVPKTPTVLWRTVGLEAASSSWDRGRLEIRIRGVPQTGRLTVFCVGLGRPSVVLGPLSVLSYSADRQLAEVEVTCPEEGEAVGVLVFGASRPSPQAGRQVARCRAHLRGRTGAGAPHLGVEHRPCPTDSPTQALAELRAALAPIRSRNYTDAQAADLKEAAMRLMESADRARPDEREDLLAGASHALMVCDALPLVDGIKVQRLAHVIERDHLQPMEWLAIGPFPNPQCQGFDTAYPPERELRLDAAYEASDIGREPGSQASGAPRARERHTWESSIDRPPPGTSYEGAVTGLMFGWEALPPDTGADGAVQAEAGLLSWVKVRGYYVDFCRLFKPQPILFRPLGEAARPTVAYAYTEVESPRLQESLMRVRVNGGIKVWLNGRLALERHEHGDRWYEGRRYEVPVELSPGRNRLLVKVDDRLERQNEQAGVMFWQFSLQFDPADELRFALPENSLHSSPAHDLYENVQAFVDARLPSVALPRRYAPGGAVAQAAGL